MATAKTRKRATNGGARTLRNVVTTAAATETIIDLVQRLGLVDLIVARLKSRLQDTDVDELFDEVADYFRRNPEVLVVTLGAVTVATGLLVYLNNRREWDGVERRRAS
jgi:excinuclease UvrABC helicase subunit UvrB